MSTGKQTLKEKEKKIFHRFFKEEKKIDILKYSRGLFAHFFHHKVCVFKNQYVL